MYISIVCFIKLTSSNGYKTRKFVSLIGAPYFKNAFAPGASIRRNTVPTSLSHPGPLTYRGITTIKHEHIHINFGCVSYFHKIVLHIPTNYFQSFLKHLISTARNRTSVFCHVDRLNTNSLYTTEDGFRCMSGTTFKIRTYRWI